MKIYWKILSVAIVIVGFTGFVSIDKLKGTAPNNSNMETALSIPQSLSEQHFGQWIGIKSPSIELDLQYTVRRWASGRNPHVIALQKLKQAHFISDLIEYYPSNWIAGYNSVEVLRTINGKEMKAVSPDATLTKEQKQLLNLVDMASDIVINVNYKSKNAVTNNIENRQMHLSMIVVPETIVSENEAEYIGGYDKMINYLKENSIDEISTMKIKLLPQLSISFFVNENGKTENIKLTKTSGNAEIDKLLIELVREMPNWNPGKDIQGSSVKQKFVLDVGQSGC